MNIILTSASKELREIFNSERFRLSNYQEDYSTGNEKFSWSHIPVVGDCLYFIDNYYHQIPVQVTRICVNQYNELMVWCTRIELSAIDPYLYTANELSEEAKNEILSTYNHHKKSIKSKYEKEKINNPNLDEFGFAVASVADYMDIRNRTIIDMQNVFYLIDSVLAPKFGVEWHRPYDWEFTDW